MIIHSIPSIPFTYILFMGLEHESVGKVLTEHALKPEFLFHKLM